MSLKVVNLDANDTVPISATVAPVPPCEVFGGDNDARLSENKPEPLFEDGRRRFDVEEAERRPESPNILPVLGGRGGGEPSGETFPSEP